MPSWTHHRARYAALSRDRAPDDPELVAARQALAEARQDPALRVERLAEAIRKAVDAAPPLTDEQRTRLAALLNTPAGSTR
jgi:hypothetical protein